MEKTATVLDGFHKELFALMRMCRGHLPGDLLLEDVYNKMKFVRDHEPFFIIDACKGHIWNYRDYIVGEDEQFFLSTDWSGHIGADRRELTDFADRLKAAYSSQAREEKRKIWLQLQKILQHVVNYLTLAE